MDSGFPLPVDADPFFIASGSAYWPSRFPTTRKRKIPTGRKIDDRFSKRLLEAG
jgi:hypothetical protein